jgi:hypothetical protein
MFPGVELKISPNGLYRLFVSAHPLMISAPAPDSAANAVEAQVGQDLPPPAAVTWRSALQGIMTSAAPHKIE